MVFRLPRVLAVALTLLIVAPASPAPALDMGSLAFPNSGAPAAQPAFLRGLFLLHNFEYPYAAAAFREAQAADPGFALAYWGEAMTYNHAVWFEQDAAKARAALARLAPTPAERITKARTPREKAYMEAVETLYGDGTKNDRDMRYSAAMARLHARFPEDIDATAFYALSILGTSHNGRDVPTYMRAAALLEEVYPQHQDHPGVLHYLIHSYDDAAHAPLGLRPARLYGRFAADAPHAMHMTSHIFIALGMWDDVIRANVEAMRYVGLRDAKPGAPKSACGHYDDFALYAYLQERKFDAANAMLADCSAYLTYIAQVPTTRPATIERYTDSYADSLVRVAIARGVWPADAAMPARQTPSLDARFELAYGKALVAGMHGRRADDDAAQMDRALAELRALPQAEGNAPRTFVQEEIMVAQVRALGLIADGKRDAGIAALREAAAKERAMPAEFGPPPVPKPTSELLGDVLRAAGRTREAADAYRATLAAYPGRIDSLDGLKAVGESAVASDHDPRYL